MIQLRRRNTAWLTVLGLIIAFALLAGSATISAPVQLTLLAIFMVAMLASVVAFGKDRETLIDAIRRAPLRQRVSPQAREALERAKSHGGFVSSGLFIMDVGLIASTSSYEGMAMRRTRSTSKDDDGVRPFVTLNIEPDEAERNAVVRFEITDHQGEQKYVHEMRTYLRDGEMSIMADHHLPLAGNRDIQGAGEWDLRVYIDGNLAVLHSFTMAPSINERTRRLAGDYQAEERYNQFEIIDEVKQEVPPSLQDLLSPQSRQRSSSQSERSDSADEGAARRISTTTRRRR